MNEPLWKRLAQRIWLLIGGVNVRTKIMGIVLGGTLLLSTGLTLQMRVAIVHVMEEELQARGLSIGRDLAARSTDLILVNDLYALRQLLVETQTNNPDVRYAFILDEEGQVLAHTFGSGFPTGLYGLNSAEPTEYGHTVLVETDEGHVWDVAVPVFDGKAGTARVGITDAGVSRVLWDLTSQVLLTTLVVLGLSLLAAVTLTFVLTRPILELVQATRSLAKGNFTHRVRRWANDEIGELAAAFNLMAVELERLDELRSERETLRRQLLDGVITAQEEERRRIARELHDSTSQSLTSLMVGLHNVDAASNQPGVHEQIKELREIASTVLDDVHNLALQLRPPVLDDIGLHAALERLAGEWQARYHIQADIFVHTGSQRLPENMETAIYRIVQEALTNIARHACARSVSILVEKRPGEIVTVVEDDGIGFDAEQVSKTRGLGLVGVRERAELLGGSLSIETHPGRGTSLFIRIPAPLPEERGKEPSV